MAEDEGPRKLTQPKSPNLHTDARSKFKNIAEGMIIGGSADRLI